MLLGKCLQKGVWDALRADLDRRPIEGMDGSMSENQILSILNKYGISVELNDERSDLHSFMHTTSSVVVSLWGTGSPFREFLHADDLADACVFLMQQYEAIDIGEFVNIGTGDDLTIRELSEMVVKAVEYKGKVVWDDTKPDGTPQKRLDISRLVEFGWQSRILLDDGVEGLYASYSCCK
jgi:GDP-L-fucose synthase